MLVQSKECLEKVPKTVSFLAPTEGSFLLLLTGKLILLATVSCQVN